MLFCKWWKNTSPPKGQRRQTVLETVLKSVLKIGEFSRECFRECFRECLRECLGVCFRQLCDSIAQVCVPPIKSSQYSENSAWVATSCFTKQVAGHRHLDCSPLHGYTTIARSHASTDIDVKRPNNSTIMSRIYQKLTSFFHPRGHR